MTIYAPKVKATPINMLIEAIPYGEIVATLKELDSIFHSEEKGSERYFAAAVAYDTLTEMQSTQCPECSSFNTSDRGYQDIETGEGQDFHECNICNEKFTPQ